MNQPTTCVECGGPLINGFGFEILLMTGHEVVCRNCYEDRAGLLFGREENTSDDEERTEGSYDSHQ